jgi:hypothetical protein
VNELLEVRGLTVELPAALSIHEPNLTRNDRAERAVNVEAQSLLRQPTQQNTTDLLAVPKIAVR